MFQIKWRNKMSCGKVLGHGLYCADGYECSECQQIAKLKAFIKKMANSKCEFNREAESILDEHVKLSPATYNNIVELGKQMS